MADAQLERCPAAIIPGLQARRNQRRRLRGRNATRAAHCFPGAVTQRGLTTGALSGTNRAIEAA